MKLPVVSGDALISFFQKQGFTVVRQKGSHVSLHRKDGEGRNTLVVVPKGKEIRKGTLLSIIRQSKMDKEEFIQKFQER